MRHVLFATLCLFVVGCKKTPPAAPATAPAAPASVAPVAPQEVPPAKPKPPEEKPAPSKPATVVQVGSGQLIDDYRANEAAADAKYLGNTLSISVPVTGVKKDRSGNYYTWVSPFAYHPDAEVLVFRFKGDQAKVLAERRVPSRMTIRGSCKGKERTLSANYGGDQNFGSYPVVVIDDCILAD
jgi:hypothetical protein